MGDSARAVFAKWTWGRAEALAEFHHPILCCFVGVVPVSTALVGLAVRPYAPSAALTLAAIGIVGQLIFGLYRTGQLWKGGRDPSTTTPVLYLPTVAGSFVSTNAGYSACAACRRVRRVPQHYIRATGFIRRPA